MKGIVFALALGAGCFAIPSISNSAPADASFVVAQDVDVRVGPGGVRIGGGDRDGRERFERRRERGFEEGRGERRFGERRGEGCRVVIVRRETPSGVRVTRTRRCG